MRHVVGMLAWKPKHTGYTEPCNKANGDGECGRKVGSMERPGIETGKAKQGIIKGGHLGRAPWKSAFAWFA